MDECPIGEAGVRVFLCLCFVLLLPRVAPLSPTRCRIIAAEKLGPEATYEILQPVGAVQRYSQAFDGTLFNCTTVIDMHYRWALRSALSGMGHATPGQDGAAESSALRSAQAFEGLHDSGRLSPGGRRVRQPRPGLHPARAHDPLVHLRTVQAE